MTNRTPPFAGFEWLIAWRYLNSKRSDGGVSVMTLISLAGIAIAVFALIATLAVRSGYRAEFVGTILGASAHLSVTADLHTDPDGRPSTAIAEYEDVAERIKAVEGVASAAPIIKAQLLASSELRNSGVQLYGMRFEDFDALPLIANPDSSEGDHFDIAHGVAIGTGVARALAVGVGDEIRLVSPDGVRTAFGTAPRINAYEVVYIFGAGRYDIDRVRVYMTFSEAQYFLDREGSADEIEVFVEDPESVELLAPAVLAAAGPEYVGWSWKDSSGAFLRALETEDNVMFVILSILVLIAASNIVSGLVMLVKNKGRDIGILRTIGLSEGAVLRIFFICGASVGLVGTAIGVAMGCLFAIYIDPIFAFVNYAFGGGVWDPEIRLLPTLPAKLEMEDVLSAVGLSLFLSFGITLFPARRAARMNPIEALRYE